MSSEKDSRLSAKDETPVREDVLAKVGNDEVLTLRELETINEAPARPHVDDLDIGKRYESSDYAPAAQPDLNAPAYVLVKQAKLAAEGKDDTRVGAGAVEQTTEDEQAGEEVAAKKAAAKKTAN